MAAADVGFLASSAQVFGSNRTLPQIRAIHKALQAQIDDKSARLRTQVGGSYRELLGTADEIVAMSRSIEAVQATLADMGGRCGRTVVVAKVGCLGAFVRAGAGAGPGRQMGRVARARLLGGCVLAAAKALRPSAVADGAGRLVLAAKVLVLSRLLAKSLDESNDDDDDEAMDAGLAASVEASKKSLETLKRKLLRSIDKVLALTGEGSSREDVLKALCACSLATSSGARDVLRHFLRVRGKALALAFELEAPGRDRSTKDVLRCLELYTKTLLDVQALVPNKLTEALLGLQKNALLADQALRSSECLRLDVCERWCGDDVQHFKPYIRHEDLDGQTAKQMLMSWANQGGEALMQGLEMTLERLFEFSAIVETRTSVLQFWIRVGGRAKGFESSVMLDRLRGAINMHMLQVLHMKVGKLRLVGSEIVATLESWQQGVAGRQLALWDHGGCDTALSDGAARFAQDVVSRLYGSSDAVAKAIACYKSWHRVIDDVGAVVVQLQRQRWDGDVDEIEDEDVIDHRQQLLSKDDPKMLTDRLDSALEAAFGELDKTLAKEWQARCESAGAGSIAMYFARILRDIRSRLPPLQAVQSFGLALVPSIHERMVVAVALPPIDKFAASALSRSATASTSLWEGEPRLPTSPSPATFEFLRNLSLAMSHAGMDLWSPAAVSALKEHTGKRLACLWHDALTALGPNADGEGERPAAAVEAVVGEAESDEAASSAPDPERRRELLAQWHFDVSLLRRCLSSAPTGISSHHLLPLEDAISIQSGLQSGDGHQRLHKASQEYWNRTGLLFGLLA